MRLCDCADLRLCECTETGSLFGGLYEVQGLDRIVTFSSPRLPVSAQGRLCVWAIVKAQFAWRACRGGL